MTDAAFEVTYVCGNCGDEWQDTHEPRVDIRDSTSSKDVRVYDRDCDQMGTHACECCYNVDCPVCELRDDVYVEGREPLTGDSDE